MPYLRVHPALIVWLAMFFTAVDGKGAASFKVEEHVYDNGDMLLMPEWAKNQLDGASLVFCPDVAVVGENFRQEIHAWMEASGSGINLAHVIQSDQHPHGLAQLGFTSLVLCGAHASHAAKYAVLYGPLYIILPLTPPPVGGPVKYRVPVVVVLAKDTPPKMAAQWRAWAAGFRSIVTTVETKDGKLLAGWSTWMETQLLPLSRQVPPLEPQAK